jgi:hypothetical protein
MKDFLFQVGFAVPILLVLNSIIHPTGINALATGMVAMMVSQAWTKYMGIAR